MKNKIIVIYYIIAIIFIISGFILGTNTKTYNEGYTVYDYTHKVLACQQIFQKKSASARRGGAEKREGRSPPPYDVVMPARRPVI